MALRKGTWSAACANRLYPLVNHYGMYPLLASHLMKPFVTARPRVKYSVHAHNSNLPRYEYSLINKPFSSLCANRIAEKQLKSGQHHRDTMNKVVNAFFLFYGWAKRVIIGQPITNDSLFTVIIKEAWPSSWVRLLTESAAKALCAD
jgi:hypothetical protein